MESFTLWEMGALTGLTVGLVIVLFVVALLFIAALYVYHAIALRDIARKMKHKKPWLAWIPFANVVLIFQMGNFHWAFVFLFLIPFLGWAAILVLMIISYWRIFEKLGYAGALSLVLIGTWIPGVSFFAYIAYLVILGVVAWSNEGKIERINVSSGKKKVIARKSAKKKKVKKVSKK